MGVDFKKFQISLLNDRGIYFIIRPLIIIILIDLAIMLTTQWFYGLSYGQTQKLFLIICLFTFTFYIGPIILFDS